MGFVEANSIDDLPVLGEIHERRYADRTPLSGYVPVGYVALRTDQRVMELRSESHWGLNVRESEVIHWLKQAILPLLVFSTRDYLVKGLDREIMLLGTSTATKYVPLSDYSKTEIIECLARAERYDQREG